MEWPHQSSNTTGVFLEITEGRSLYFTPRETVIFGYFFDLADTDDDGLVGGADGGHALLGRARLPPETLARLWSEAGGGSPDACLARPQWFVLLALVALAQAGLPCTLRDLLNACDSPSSSLAPPGSISAAMSARGPGQSKHSQQQQGYQPNHHVHPGGSYPQQNNNPMSPSTHQGASRPRPIPDFFLDGGVPSPRLKKRASGSSRRSLQTSAERGGAESRRRGGRSKSKGGRGFVERGSGHGQGSWEEWEDGAREGEGVLGTEEEEEIDDEEDDGYHLEITVYSHRIVGEGYGSHTEYTVLANASVPRFARRELEVARRFSDFRWLHGCFRAIPGVLPPPLPPSKWAGSSSRDFVAERMKGLQRYMTRVAQHPVLRRQYALQVFLEGTPRGLRAAKALLPGAGSGWTDTFSPMSKTVGGNPTSPALSASPGTTPPDESGGFVRRRFSLGGADDLYGGNGVVVGVGGNVRQGQRRSMSFGASSDDSSGGGGGGGGAGVWTGGPGGAGNAGSTWPLSVVATVGYEAYGNYVATSLSSIKGVLSTVKTKARSVVGLVAGPAPIAVEPDPVYDMEVAHVDELVAPVSGSVKVMESAALLKRGVGYEMSRLGHYLTQVASLEDTDGVPLGGVALTGSGADVGSRGERGSEAEVTGGLGNSRGGAGLAKAEQVLGQRMERVATAWLEAIDQEESEFLDPLREQLGYLGSAKEVHRGRGRALDALQAANGSLQRNKQRLHAARAQGDAHAAAVSTSKMEGAEERMSGAQARAALISKTFKGEAKRFHACRQTEGIAAVLELARAQATFARKANAAWKQVLEDINPTDDELRQSQQRVQHPKREARIGEGKSRSGRGLSGWLGGTSTGRELTVGSSTSGIATVENGSSGNRRVVENGHREYGRSNAAVPGPSLGGNRGARLSTGENASSGSDRGHGVSRDTAARRGRALGMGSEGLGSGLGSRSPAGDNSKTSSLWVQEEETNDVRGAHVQANRRSRTSDATATSTTFHFKDDWESLEQPPPPAPVESEIRAQREQEALTHRDAGDDGDDSTATGPSIFEPVSTTAGISFPEQSANRASLPSSRSVDPSPSSPTTHEIEPEVALSPVVVADGVGGGGGGVSSIIGAVSDSVQSATIAAVSSSTAGSGAGTGGTTMTAAARRRASRKEAKLAKSLATKAAASQSSSTGGGNTNKNSASLTAPPTPSDVPTFATPARTATALSLMDSLEALSSSGGGEGSNEENSDSKGAARTLHGESKGEYRSGGDGDDDEGFKDQGGANVSDLAWDDLESDDLAVRSSSVAANAQSAGGDDAAAEGQNGDTAKNGPEIGSGSIGSGSGSGSGGFGTVSAPTTVARLAGSPNPPARRGSAAKQSRGSAGDGESRAADAGSTRLAPNGGRSGRSKGK